MAPLPMPRMVSIVSQGTVLGGKLIEADQAQLLPVITEMAPVEALDGSEIDAGSVYVQVWAKRGVASNTKARQILIEPILAWCCRLSESLPLREYRRVRKSYPRFRFRPGARPARRPLQGR